MTGIIDRVKGVFLFDKKEFIIPNHIAICLEGAEEWAHLKEKSFAEAYHESFYNLYKMIHEQVKFNIKSMSILVTGSKDCSKEFVEALAKLLSELEKDDFVRQNKIKISVLGKWYEMPHDIVEKIKRAMEKTQSHDGYYLNLCINYDGKQEIIDACKLISKKIGAEKLETNAITNEIIMQNLYSSNALPIQLLIKNGKNNRINGFMLWQSIGAVVHLSQKYWPEFNDKDILKAIIEYNKIAHNI
jgi:undecaprenyl diphosphate synthase